MLGNYLESSRMLLTGFKTLLLTGVKTRDASASKTLIKNTRIHTDSVTVRLFTK